MPQTRDVPVVLRCVTLLYVFSVNSRYVLSVNPHYVLSVNLRLEAQETRTRTHEPCVDLLILL